MLSVSVAELPDTIAVRSELSDQITEFLSSSGVQRHRASLAELPHLQTQRFELDGRTNSSWWRRFRAHNVPVELSHHTPESDTIPSLNRHRINTAPPNESSDANETPRFLTFSPTWLGIVLRSSSVAPPTTLASRVPVELPPTYESSLGSARSTPVSPIPILLSPSVGTRKEDF